MRYNFVTHFSFRQWNIWVSLYQV